MEEPHDVNPLTKLWTKLVASSLLTLCMYEYFCLAEIAIACVIGSVEDERTFNTLTFIKSYLRNRMGVHLNCTILMYAQGFWQRKTFPYLDAITIWAKVKEHLGVHL